jgi:hypothetical protein
MKRVASRAEYNNANVNVNFPYDMSVCDNPNLNDTKMLNLNDKFQVGTC